MKEKTESETRDHRWIAISGLLFVAAWVPMANLIAYYEANRQMVMVQAYLTNGLTGILLMVFVAALQSALRRAEGESSTLSNLLLRSPVRAGRGESHCGHPRCGGHSDPVGTQCGDRHLQAADPWHHDCGGLVA